MRAENVVYFGKDGKMSKSDSEIIDMMRALKQEAEDFAVIQKKARAITRKLELKTMMREAKRRLRDPDYRKTIQIKIEEARASLMDGHQSKRIQTLKPAAVEMEYDKVDNGIQIGLKMLNGQHMSLVVDPFGSAKDLKSKVVQKVGIPADQQHLIFDGKELADSDILADRGIQENSEIVLTITLNAAADDAQIFFVIPENASPNPNTIKTVLSEAANNKMKVCFDYTSTMPVMNKKVNDLKELVLATRASNDKKIKENYAVMGNRMSKIEDKVEGLASSPTKKGKKGRGGKGK